MWIAWTVYVWSTNGSTAGLGVLISWPVVFGAVALVVAPFVLIARLILRNRNGRGAEPPSPAAAMRMGTR